VCFVWLDCGRAPRSIRQLYQTDLSDEEEKQRDSSDVAQPEKNAIRCQHLNKAVAKIALSKVSKKVPGAENGSMDGSCPTN